MNSMLVQVPEIGTARRAALPSIRSAGKTGTTQSYRDAWYVGFTGNYTAAVWMGNDDFHPTRDMTGGSLPAMTWQRLMDLNLTSLVMCTKRIGGAMLPRRWGRIINIASICSYIAGRNILRGNKTNSMDVSLNKGFRLPFEGHKLEVRFDFFNVFNHPNFTWAILGSDNSNGDVTNPFFNNVRLNDGGFTGPVGTTVGRYGRIQLRYTF